MSKIFDSFVQTRIASRKGAKPAKKTSKIKLSNLAFLASLREKCLIATRSIIVCRILLACITLLLAGCGGRELEVTGEFQDGGQADACTADGCDAGAPPDAGSWCRAEQPFPYAVNSPYVGLHANRENNNRVPCKGPTAAERGWNALAGYLVFQPISVSPGGRTIYAAAARTSGCKLFAVDAATGQMAWCRPEFTLGLTGGTHEVDEDGFIYVTDGYVGDSAMYSLTPEGAIRWRTSLQGLGGAGPAKYRSPAGLHLTPGGYAATVTVDGVVVLLDRTSGVIRATFDIPAATGFVPPSTGDAIDPERIPDYLLQRLTRVVGPLTNEDIAFVFGAAGGTSGAFSDNTVGVSSLNQLLVIGGGPDTATGALVALDVTEPGAAPSLALRWHMTVPGGSATSPAISKDGTRAAIGNNSSELMYVRVDRCNENTDADSRPEVFAPAWKHPILGRSLLGSVGLDEDGVVYTYNSSAEASDPDLFAVRDADGGPIVLWEKSFATAGGTNRQWTSATTVLDNVVIGTVADMKSVVKIEGVPFPVALDVSHETVAVDRRTGELVWRKPLDDDSFNSPAFGSDGSVYIPLCAMMDLVSPGASVGFTGGIIQYRAE